MALQRNRSILPYLYQVLPHFPNSLVCTHQSAFPPCNTDLAHESCMQVNKIREVPQHPHIVVTHTDKPQLYVWNLETQPNRASDKVPLPTITPLEKHL